MAKKPAKRNKRPAVTISFDKSFPAKNAQVSKVRTATPSKVRNAAPSIRPVFEATMDTGVRGRSGTAYRNYLSAFTGEFRNPKAPAGAAVRNIATGIVSSTNKMVSGAVDAANAREAARKAERERLATNRALGNRSNMPAPDMRGKTKPTPAVRVARPTAPAARPAAARPAPAPASIARPVPLPPRRPAAQSTSNLPAGGNSPRTMSGDYSTAQPKLDTNKGYEPNKTGFFDKLHRSLGGRGNATYKYSTGDNRSDKD